MPYTTQYQIIINPKGTSDQVVVSIFDKLTFSSDPFMPSEIVPLNDNKGRIPAGGLKIQTVDDSESKYTTIKAKRAVFSFFSSAQFNIGTFSSGEDDRWIVEITLNNLLLFKGFLVLNDISMDYQPDPNVITLTASDNLALLKDVPLTDFTNLNPKGHFKVAQFIAWALAKTGMSLDICVINNICEQSAPGVPFYASCYLDAKTFEKEIGVSEDCYTVLTKILGEDAFLTQWQGKWWILRLDEMADNPAYQHLFTFQGVYAGFQSSFNINQDINFGSPITLINDSTNITIERPVKEVVETFKLENPLEIIDNIDFSRGTLISPLSLPADFSGYTVADWTVGVYLSSATPPADAAIIVKKIVNGYEKERYLRLKQPDTQAYFVKSNPFPIDTKDKFSISVDTRLASSLGGSGFRRAGVMQVRLSGYTGQNYFLHGPTSVDPNPRWVLTNSTFSTNTDFVYIEQDLSDDETSWTSASCEAPPSPVDGDLEIWLINQGPNVGLPETHFQNLTFDYIPLINDSYQKYSGQYNKVYNNKNYKATHDVQVYISDSPKKLFKGALKKLVGGKYILAELFYNAAVFPGSSLPDPQFLHPFGFIQAFAVWNQYNREFLYFDCSMENLRTADGVFNVADLLHNYRIQDSTVYTRNKYFMLLHIIQDFDTNQLTTKMVEMWDVLKPKIYTDLFEFKYLTGS